MKKYLSFSMALLMVLSLAGCSSGNPSPSSESAEFSSAEVSPESSSAAQASGEADGALPENPGSADNSSDTEENGQESTTGSDP